MTAVEQITAALDEAERALDYGTEGTWHIWQDILTDGFIWVGDEQGVRSEQHRENDECDPIAKVFTEQDADLIVSVVNRERAQIQHARDVLARHTFGTQNWADGQRLECIRCHLPECPEIASLLAVWCPEPTP